MSCSGSNGVSETVLSEITLLLGQDRESTDLLVKDLAPAGVANLLLDIISEAGTSQHCCCLSPACHNKKAIRVSFYNRRRLFREDSVRFVLIHGEYQVKQAGPLAHPARRQLRQQWPRLA
jgi:hypothetical protein